MLLDLTAAFDTVNHSVLINIMQHRFGVRDTALNLHQLYITNNTQSFHTSDSVGLVQLSCSVPQGFILGPMKFITYSKDIIEMIKSYNISNHLYTVDTPLQKQMVLKDLDVIRSKIE